MNKRLKILVVAVAACCFVGMVGCTQQGGSSVSAAPSVSSQASISSTPTTPISGQEETMDIPFTSEIVRINALGGQDFPVTYSFATAQELEEFFVANNEDMGLDVPLAEITFEAQMKQYDDDFFADGALLVALLEESSGSIGHEVQKLQWANGALHLTVKRLNTEGIGTANMAQWAVFVSVPAEYAGVSLEVEIA